MSKAKKIKIYTSGKNDFKKIIRDVVKLCLKNYCEKKLRGKKKFVKKKNFVKKIFS